MPVPLKLQQVPAEPNMKVKEASDLHIEKAADLGGTKEEEKLIYYYLRACKRPHRSLFAFEFHYPVEFLKHFGYDYSGFHYVVPLVKTIGDKLLEEYRLQSLEYYYEGKDAATFSTMFFGGVGFESWSMRLPVIADEDPSDTLRRFKEGFEFVTGVRIDMGRFLFAPGSPNPITEREIVSRAVRKHVSFGISPRQGFPQNGSWVFSDIVPMIVRTISRTGGVLFQLDDRFRVWTTIWGTSGLIKKLVEVNPDLLEKARSLGVGVDVFNEVLDHPIPSHPGTTSIPLELLESTFLVRGLIAYMYVNGLIKDNAGYDLTPKEI